MKEKGWGIALIEAVTVPGYCKVNPTGFYFVLIVSLFIITRETHKHFSLQSNDGHALVQR